MGAWLAILVISLGLAATIGGTPHDDYNVKGSPSQAGTDFLAERFPERAGADARVVVHHDSRVDAADFTADLTALGTRLPALEGARGASTRCARPPRRWSGPGTRSTWAARCRRTSPRPTAPPRRSASPPRS